MEIKQFESSFLEPTVYLFGCKSDNENVSRPTFQLSQSIEIPRDYSPLIFESNSISFTLLSSYEIDHSPFRNFCIRVPRSIARFFFRKRIIYIRTIVLRFTFPNLQRGYKIICISMFRHVYRRGFRGNAVQFVITRARQVWIAPGNVIYDENFLNERSIPSVRCKISFRNVSSPFFPSIVPHFSGQLRTCYDPLTVGYIPQEI